MRVKRFSSRLPQEVIKHLDEAGDVEIISLFESNNRTVVYYSEKQVRARKLKAEKDIDNG